MTGGIPSGGYGHMMSVDGIPLTDAQMRWLDKEATRRAQQVIDAAYAAGAAQALDDVMANLSTVAPIPHHELREIWQLERDARYLAEIEAAEQRTVTLNENRGYDPQYRYSGGVVPWIPEIVTTTQNEDFQRWLTLRKQLRLTWPLADPAEFSSTDPTCGRR